jgi:hypothetical protein
MGEIPEEAIRLRAYHIWEREGRPHGRDQEHWVQAQVELGAEVMRVQPPRAAAPSPPQARSNGGKAAAAKPGRSAAGRGGRGKR